MKSYLCYVRVSTVKQGEQGSSLIEQRSAIKAHARKQHFAILYEERETAAKLVRPIPGQMLLDLERTKAAGIIVHKIDRSARNLKYWAAVGELIDRGVEVHSADESLDLTSRGGRLAAGVQAVVAADYIRTYCVPNVMVV